MACLIIVSLQFLDRTWSLTIFQYSLHFDFDIKQRLWSVRAMHTTKLVICKMKLMEFINYIEIHFICNKKGISKKEDFVLLKFCIFSFRFQSWIVFDFYLAELSFKYFPFCTQYLLLSNLFKSLVLSVKCLCFHIISKRGSIKVWNKA